MVQNRAGRATVYYVTTLYNLSLPQTEIWYNFGKQWIVSMEAMKREYGEPVRV